MIRIILHRDEQNELYISSVLADNGSITNYPSDVAAVYVDTIEEVKAACIARSIDIQPILDYEETI